MNKRGWMVAARQVLPAGLCLLVLAAGTLVARADDPPAAAKPAEVQLLSLDQAIQHALDHQPNVAAARATLASAQVARDAAYSTFSSLAGPIILVRRKQADLGVQAAEANVAEAELNTVHAVTRAYLTVIFAQDQLKVAEYARDRFRSIRNDTDRLLKAGGKNVSAADLDRVDTYTLLAESRVVEAQQGILRAKAALREAIGAANNCHIDFSTDTIQNYYKAVSKYCSEHGARLSCCALVNAAIQNRPEIAQAALFADIACLEIDAQSMSCCTYVKTFAATADIHVKVLSATIINGEYRPGALAEEMPVYLAGSRHSRMSRAAHLAERARIVVDKTKSLVALEVEDACHRLGEEAGQIAVLEQATEKAKKNVDNIFEAFRAQSASVGDRLEAQMVEANARSQLNDSYYRYGVALATLQKATAGKVWSCLEKLASAEPAEELKKTPAEAPKE